MTGLIDFLKKKNGFFGEKSIQPNLTYYYLKLNLNYWTNIEPQIADFETVTNLT